MMRASTITDKIMKVLRLLLITAFWVGVWQVVHLIIGRDIYVPSAFVVFDRLLDLVQTREFWEIVYASMVRVLIGVMISFLLGVSFGIIAGLNKWVYALFNPLMVVIKSTPVISIIIVALVWFTSSNVPVFISFLMCFPIIWTNTVTGIQNVDQKLLQMAKVYQVHRRDVILKIYFPSLTPFMNAAMITALGLAWKVSVAAEVLSHPRKAIGSELYTSKAYLDSPTLFAWTLVVVMLSLIFEFVLARLVKKWSPYRR